MALPHGVLTDTDLQEMPDDGHRYELVDGGLLVTPSPGFPHQEALAELFVRLRLAAPPDVVVLAGPFDYKVSDLTVLIPDILVMRRSDVGLKRLETTPLLVVEALSPSTQLNDLGTKRLAYERAGVPAYWILNPAVPSLTVLHLGEDGRYVEVALVEGSDSYTAEFPFPVTIVPAQLVAGIPEGLGT